MSIFKVTNTNDSGSGSLRQAIADANARSGKDSINFDGIFADKIADTITLGGSSLVITDDLIVNGTGAEKLTISGNNYSRIFEIDNGSTVEIAGLTITNGSAQGGGGIYNNFNSTLIVSNSIITNNRTYSGYGGGGILNLGIATVNNTIISYNSGGAGGGIDNQVDTLTINNSTISYNKVSGDGGGIGSQADLTINNSVISNNESDFNGGGIYTLFNTKISNSTISGNSAGHYGGAIVNGYNLILTNSTISGNSAGYNGGGIAANSGTLTLNNSTITFNTAYNNDSTQLSGGGIFLSNSGNSTYDTVNNSIIAGNTAIGSPDVTGIFTSNGHNLIGSLSGSTGFNADEQLNVPLSDVIDTTLKNNGGPTQTYALVIGSPAINAGLNADVPADSADLDGDGNTTEPVPYDQRGAGFNRIANGTVDIGAYELQENAIYGTKGNDTINGTDGNDIITGLRGRDILSGGGGADSFVYTSIQDLGDTITDFQAGTDKIVLSQLFGNLNLGNLDYTSAITGGYVQFTSQGNNTIVWIDPDGTAGKGRAVKLVTVDDVSATTLNNSINFIF